MKKIITAILLIPTGWLAGISTVAVCVWWFTRNMPRQKQFEVRGLAEQVDIRIWMLACIISWMIFVLLLSYQWKHRKIKSQASL